MGHLAVIDTEVLEELRVLRDVAEALEPSLAELSERACRCFALFDDVPSPGGDAFEDAEAFWERTGVTRTRDAFYALAAHLCGAVGESYFDEPVWLIRARGEQS
jgi:hypothetical protein